MDQQSNNDLEKIPSIGISYQLTLQNNERQLVMQSFVPRDCSKDDLNAVLDKIRNAGERQRAFSLIEDFNRLIEQEYQNARDQAVRIEEQDMRVKADWQRSSKRGDVRLTDHQAQKQREAYEIAEGIKNRIAKLQKGKTDWETKLATL